MPICRCRNSKNVCLRFLDWQFLSTGTVVSIDCIHPNDRVQVTLDRFIIDSCMKVICLDFRASEPPKESNVYASDYNILGSF